MKWAWDLPKLLALPRLPENNWPRQVDRWHPLTLQTKVKETLTATFDFVFTAIT